MADQPVLPSPSRHIQQVEKLRRVSTIAAHQLPPSPGYDVKHGTPVAHNTLKRPREINLRPIA